jgi:3-methyladenine DNA glycosylase AlkC
MAEPLKNLFDERVLVSVAADIRRVHPTFDARGFVDDATRGIEHRSLMERGHHAADCLRRALPAHYDDAVRVLVASLGPPLPEDGQLGNGAFRYLAHVAFVQRYGLDSPERSLDAQHALTQRFTAEWCVRPYIERHFDLTYARLTTWTADRSAHVRRLVSEGTRPRLPWASRLRRFQEDPTPALALLERLKDDSSVYVRRSVANHLNDVAKDHPALVVDRCAAWVGSSRARMDIVSHALRSLVKAGDPSALAVLGLRAEAHVRVEGVRAEPPRPRVGQTVTVSCELVSTSKRTEDVLVDYAVDYVKSNGETRAKVFKLRRFALGPGEAKPLTFRIAFVQRTTRTHYPGRHPIALLVNGIPFPLTAVELRP